mmetsp:Transcript_7756/g.8872  ORF Transcript_7756/g.8872 Transcript_7756/m.8872 type:complete len:176 (+) Transcript_7756:86-613(+)
MKIIDVFLTIMILESSFAFSLTGPSQPNDYSGLKTQDLSIAIHDFFKTALVTTCLLTPALSNAAPDFAYFAPTTIISASYSQNAKNFDRINAGDLSGGSVYNNNPPAPGARRRRAMQGCKIQSTREEASIKLNLKQTLSERECNLRVMDDSPDFMLTSMQALDCPKCPYGVKASR